MMTTKASVSAAARWWADQLGRLQTQYNGDECQSLLATCVATLATPLSPIEQSAFIAELETVLTPRGEGYGVDYGPDPELGDALCRAIGEARAREVRNLWPIKTMMWIEGGEVRVSKGYGAVERQIYPAGG